MTLAGFSLPGSYICFTYNLVLMHFKLFVAVMKSVLSVLSVLSHSFNSIIIISESKSYNKETSTTES